MDLRHCVIPAAGLGTRFLPATKVLPKELLPVLDRPAMQWAVEEALAAGTDTMVTVLGRGKELLAAHFDRAPELERTLRQRGRDRELEAVIAIANMARFTYVYQPEALGLGHAVLCAEPVVQGNWFTCLLPDDLSWGAKPVLQQLVEAHSETGTPILALMRCPKDHISRYGVAAVSESRGRMHRVAAVVEKPSLADAPSDLAIMGRYVLPPELFDALRATQPGSGGEIQLTDGIGALLGERPVWGLEFEGELLDVGTPLGWLRTTARLARAHPDFADAFATEPIPA